MTPNSNFLSSIENIVGKKRILTGDGSTRFYRSGFRIGSGEAEAVILPDSLTELWKCLQVCVAHDRIIIMQAANTGLNGGSTPYGEDYDRPVVIINTKKLDDIVLLNQGEQVLAYPGATLYRLEEKLDQVGRAPHSVIGSSCIGASIVGGVCNNSGGNLVQRGPAYTELALYAQLNADGTLELVNHLDIDLGETPEEILEKLDAGNIRSNKISRSNRVGSDQGYEERVRDTESDTPARYNANPERLYEASGCAGKLAVFAVRLDTFEKPKSEQVFFIGTNDPSQLTLLRKRILTEFHNLPESGEYMHRSYFEGSERYCKDTYLFIKFLGSSFLPKLFQLKARVDSILGKIPFLPRNFADKFLYYASRLLPAHLPKRMREYRDAYEHYLILDTADGAIAEARALLNEIFSSSSEGGFFECTESEGKAALLHRFVAGGASGRFAIVHAADVEGLMPFDIALARNDEDWPNLVPPKLASQLAAPFTLAHFFCHVFHLDFVAKKGANIEFLKAEFHTYLTDRGAKYPAEHNVGHIYDAEGPLRDFYMSLDPTNSLNPGIGKTSKCKHYS